MYSVPDHRRPLLARPARMIHSGPVAWSSGEDSYLRPTGSIPARSTKKARTVGPPGTSPEQDSYVRIVSRGPPGSNSTATAGEELRNG